MFSACISPTVSSLEVNEGEKPESIDIYFERDTYSYDELDEIFYVIENNSESTIDLSPMYAIERYEDEEWVSQTNHNLHQIEQIITILPKESKEFSVWLSVNSVDFEEGIYRVYTKIENKDVYLPFEIK